MDTANTKFVKPLEEVESNTNLFRHIYLMICLMISGKEFDEKEQS
jgi:hypothetical protein